MSNYSRNKNEADEILLLQLFPEEIWKVILDNVKDLKSLENLSYSSSFFYQRLLPRRKMFLFPGVFECLMKKYKEDDEYFGKRPKIFYTDSEEDQFNKFPWILRMVCLEWNNSIKDYFEDPQINPFAYKKRKIFLPGQDCASAKESVQMLEKFGQLYSNVVLDFHLEDEQTLPECYMIFIAHLSKLPYLEKLKIKFNTRQYANVVDNNLTQTIEMNRCPKIDQLEDLCADQFVPSKIFGEFVRQNRDFTRLELILEDVQLLRFDFSTSFPNLTDLNVTIKLYEDLEQIKRFGKNWKLTKFSGQFRYFTERNIWIEIFQMMRDNWGDTLEEISLSFPKNDMWPPVASICELVLNITVDERLEGMKKLEFVDIFSDCAIGLDFLLPISETLIVLCVFQSGIHMARNGENKFYHPAKRRQIVDFLDKEDRLRESNIWNLFPNLELCRPTGRRILRPGTNSF